MQAIASRPPVPPTPCWPDPVDRRPTDPVETRVAAAMEQLRDLHECGDIDWNSLSALAAYEFAFLDD
jgi:hypothetical protein